MRDEWLTSREPVYIEWRRDVHIIPLTPWADCPDMFALRTYNHTGELWIGFVAFCAGKYAEHALFVNGDIVQASQTYALHDMAYTVGGLWYRVRAAIDALHVVSLRVRGDVQVRERLLRVRDTPPTGEVSSVYP